MKLGKLVLNILKIKVQKENRAKVKKTIFLSKYNPQYDIPYIDDGVDAHKFDLYFSPNKKKNCLIIDIHGGAYIFGHRRENYTFGTVFLDAGYDFASIDYIVNDGKRNTSDLIDDCVKCVSYIATHLEELGFNKDIKIAITGDSAGGHLALTVSEIFLDKTYQKELGYDLPHINLIGVMVNCPVFNYLPLAFDSLNKKGMIRMFGPKALDKEERKKYCPNVHIASLSVPLFASTCKNDFLRKSESLTLKEVMNKRPNKFIFIDLDTDDKAIGHVHNILDITTKEAQEVNNGMIHFLDELL